MAILEVNVLANGTSGPIWSADGSRTYKKNFEVITDGTENGVSIATSGHSNIPVPFKSHHSNDNMAFCTRIGPWEAHEDSYEYWTATAEYSTRVNEFGAGSVTGATSTGGAPGQPPDHPANPLDRKPKFRFSTKMIKILKQRDLNGTDYTNGANDPYPPEQREVPCLLVDVERNLPEFDFALINETVGAVNVAAFVGYAARQIRCEHMDASQEYQEGQAYYKVRGQFVFAEDDLIISTITANVRPVAACTDGWWYDWKLNAGWNKTVAGVRTPILLPGGQRPHQPVPLDFSGAPLTPGDAFKWYAFRVCRDASFAALGLFT